MKTRFFSSLFVVTILLLAISILSNAHGQDSAINDSLVQYKLDSLRTDTMTQLQVRVDQLRHQADSLQCSVPSCPIKEFYVAAKNLALARSALMLYIAQAYPQRAQMAIATAQLYKRQAVAFNDRAIKETDSQ